MVGRLAFTRSIRTAEGAQAVDAPLRLAGKGHVVGTVQPQQGALTRGQPFEHLRARLATGKGAEGVAIQPPPDQSQPSPNR